MITPKPGRPETDRTRITSVETLPCTGGDNHRLTNDNLATFCSGCGSTWAALDAEVRAGLVAPKPHHRKGRRI